MLLHLPLHIEYKQGQASQAIVFTVKTITLIVLFIFQSNKKSYSYHEENITWQENSVPILDEVGVRGLKT